jgi:hypothetical protein
LSPIVLGVTNALDRPPADTRTALLYTGGMRRRGRILAIKWGMNPNSSSLGVDVTFLLVGATALAIVTPVIGALLRWRRPVADSAQVPVDTDE